MASSIAERKEWIIEQSHEHLERMQDLQSWEHLVRYVKKHNTGSMESMAVGHALHDLLEVSMKWEESEHGFIWIDQVRLDQPDIRFRAGRFGWEVSPEGRCRAKWTIREDNAYVFCRVYFARDGLTKEAPVGLTVTEEQCLLLVELVVGL